MPYVEFSCVFQRRKDDIITEMHFSQLLRSVHPVYRMANDGLSFMVAFAGTLLNELLASATASPDVAAVAAGRAYAHARFDYFVVLNHMFLLCSAIALFVLEKATLLRVMPK